MNSRARNLPHPWRLLLQNHLRESTGWGKRIGRTDGGLHGANRLGGNSLSDLLVFGKRAGQFAAELAGKTPFGKLNSDEIASQAERCLAPFNRNTVQFSFNRDAEQRWALTRFT